MCDWAAWPHVHGSPVFADFGNGERRMYVWPEKDHLKAFRWLGNRFDAENRILATKDGQLVLAPPGPILGKFGQPLLTPPGLPVTGSGMPGGALSIVVNPPGAGGVLFASIPRPENQERGILRAFDALTLREIWDNDNKPRDGYQFAKFVPPTVGGNKLFLATADGRVLVYGN